MPIRFQGPFTGDPAARGPETRSLDRLGSNFKSKRAVDAPKDLSRSKSSGDR